MKDLNLYDVFLFFLIGMLYAPTTTFAQPCKEVIGYYPSWQWYDRANLVKPSTIDYSQYTIINYAFLYPQTNGNLMITDPWADKNLLLGSINWSVAPAGYDSSYDLGNPAYHNPNTSIVHYAHQNNVSVMISIGGWTLSNDFPAIAADPIKRTNFARSCNDAVRTYGIDGIDIDWEYPGYAPHNGTSNDKVNFTLLLQEVRDSLDALEVTLSKQLLLTAAFGAAPDKMIDIEWNNVVPLLDYINLMSYDFFGAFSAMSNHNAPLYEPITGDSTFNIDYAATQLINQYNVPPAKINMGIAFYGRSAKTTGTAGLHVPTTGAADNATFSLDDGSPLYYNILKQMHLFDDHWDSNAQVPYLTGKGALKTFLSYDDEQSIGLKAQYVVDHNLAGVIIWEITGDYIESTPGTIAGTPLSDTLNLTLCHAPTVLSNDNKQQPISDINTYPNPASDYISLDFKATNQVYEINIYNTMGSVVYSSNQWEPKIDIRMLAAGMYTIRMKSDDNYYTSYFSKIE